MERQLCRRTGSHPASRQPDRGCLIRRQAADPKVPADPSQSAEFDARFRGSAKIRSSAVAAIGGKNRATSEQYRRCRAKFDGCAMLANFADCTGSFRLAGPAMAGWKSFAARGVRADNTSGTRWSLHAICSDRGG